MRGKLKLNKDSKSEKAERIKVLTIFIILPVFVWLFYSGLFIQGKLRTGGVEYNYFKDLAASFKQGRLDIDRAPGQMKNDLTPHNGKYYLYWPPVPAIVYMGLIGSGRDTQDNLIIAAFGAINTALIIALFFMFSKKYALMLKPFEILFLAVFWAFGTVHFYMSMQGSVWYVSQVMAQTFLIASVLFMLGKTSPANLLLSSLFYSAAVYTRNDVVFAAFFLAALHISNRGKEWKKHAVADALLFILPFAFFSALNFAYNAARFDGRIFENGHRYDYIHEYFRQNISKYGITSPVYIPYNFYSEVLKPMPFCAKFPFFLLQNEGFGFLWASPFFFLLFPAAYYFYRGIKNFRAGKKKNESPLNSADLTAMAGAAVSCAGTALVIFMMVGNGWAQFAARYTLDFQLLALLFMVFMVKVWRGRYFYAYAVILLALSVYVQYFGAKYFG
jgi:hypothetical protein